jgi:hypothetical protein
MSEHTTTPETTPRRDEVPGRLLTERAAFRKELSALINKYNREAGSDTPDFILAWFLSNCLNAFDVAVHDREAWYGRREGAEVEND